MPPGLSLNRLRRLVLLAALLVLPLASHLPARAQDGATLRLGMLPFRGATDRSPIPDPVSLASNATDARDLIENLFVGLFRYDSATHSAVPVLAREWSVGEDGLTWTFHLREDIPWVSFKADTGEISALRPVSADDVVAGLRRACSPLTPSPDGPAIFAIQGCYTAAQADPLLVSAERVAGWVGAEAPDSTTLVLRTTYPLYLPALLTQPEFRPIPREFVDFTPAWPSIASSGPYVLTGFSLGERLTLARNPFWPDALAVHAERIEIGFLSDPDALAGAFANGQIDFARLGTPGQADVSVLDPAAVHLWPGAKRVVLGFGVERAFVGQTRVRQALAWAIDRAAVAAAAGSDLLPVTTLTPSGAIDGPEAAGIGYEPDAARAALAEAGYPNCGRVPEVIQIAAPRALASLAEGLIAQWSAALGCAPALFEIVPTSADNVLAYARNLIDAETTTRPHLWLTTWTPETIDAASGAANTFDCRYGLFYSGQPCGAFDTLADYAATLSAEARQEVYTRLEARLFGPAGVYPAVPLWAEAQVAAVSPTLQGVGDYGPAWWGDWQF